MSTGSTSSLDRLSPPSVRSLGQRASWTAVAAALGFAVISVAPPLWRLAFLAAAVISILVHNSVPVWIATFLALSGTMLVADTLPPLGLSPLDLASTALLMMYVSAALRGVDYRGRGMRDSQLVARRRPRWIWLGMLLAIMAALALLWLFSPRRVFPNPPLLQARAWRAVLLLWSLGIAWLVVDGLLAAVDWRRWSPKAALVYLQRVVSEEASVDLVRIERYRARKGSKVSRLGRVFRSWR